MKFSPLGKMPVEATGSNAKEPRQGFYLDAFDAGFDEYLPRREYPVLPCERLAALAVGQCHKRLHRKFLNS